MQHSQLQNAMFAAHVAISWTRGIAAAAAAGTHAHMCSCTHHECTDTRRAANPSGEQGLPAMANQTAAAATTRSSGDST